MSAEIVPFSHKELVFQPMKSAKIPEQRENSEQKVIPFIPYLRDVPLPHERNIDNAVAETADHELGHIFPAWKFGAHVSVSVKPEGNIRGKTIISGNLNFAEHQVVAAGGSVDTPHGRARGFGSDMHKVTMIYRLKGGMSPETARSQAASAVTVTPEVRRRAAEILAYVETADEGTLYEILQRAEWEIRMENGTNGKEITVDPENMEEISISEPQDGEEVPEVTIEDYDDGSQKIMRLFHNKKEKHYGCGICGLVNEHNLINHPDGVELKEKIIERRRISKAAA